MKFKEDLFLDRQNDWLLAHRRGESGGDLGCLRRLCSRIKLLMVPGKCLCHQKRKHKAGLSVNLDRSGLFLDLAPTDSLIWPRSTVTAVKLAGRVKEHTLFLMRFSLQMWCLMRPPPTMVIPELTLCIAILLISLKSPRMSPRGRDGGRNGRITCLRGYHQ